MANNIVKANPITFSGWLDMKYANYFDYPVLLTNKMFISLFHRMGEIGIFYPLMSIRYGYAPKKVKSLLDIELEMIKKLEGHGEIETRIEEGYYSEMTPFTNYITQMQIGGHDFTKILDNIWKKHLPNKCWFIIEITPAYYI